MSAVAAAIEMCGIQRARLKRQANMPAAEDTAAVKLSDMQGCLLEETGRYACSSNKDGWCAVVHARRDRQIYLQQQQH